MKDLGIKKALVLGLGKVTGKAAALALIELGVEVVVSELSSTEEHEQTARLLRKIGAETAFGEPNEDLLDWADVIIPAPGVPPSNRLLLLAARRGLRIWSEIELGARLVNGPLTCITGTNGKTTTTTLVASILSRAGRAAVACGNIGLPLVEAVRKSSPGTHYVCEVSSFQLAYIESLTPQTAVILNIAEDHLDWHGGPGVYAKAKGRITENQTHQDLLIVRAGDGASERIAAASRAGLGVFGLAPPAVIRNDFEAATGRPAEVVAGQQDGQIWFEGVAGKYPLCDIADIRLQGPANRENVVAAAAFAAHIGIEGEQINKAINDFEPMSHRSEFVGEFGGVRYVNDSKATNPHATLSALQGLSRVVLIAGGRAKGLDLSPLAGEALKLKAVVVMGEAAGDLERIFSDLGCIRAVDVEEAVLKAAGVAGPGDTVLLSPACSSLDQYRSYAERGDRFAQAVRSVGDQRP